MDRRHVDLRPEPLPQLKVLGQLTRQARHRLDGEARAVDQRRLLQRRHLVPHPKQLLDHRRRALRRRCQRARPRTAHHLTVARLRAPQQHLKPLIVRGAAAVLVGSQPAPRRKVERERWLLVAALPLVARLLGRRTALDCADRRQTAAQRGRRPHARRQRIHPHLKPRPRHHLRREADRVDARAASVADDLGALLHSGAPQQALAVQKRQQFCEAPRRRRRLHQSGLRRVVQRTQPRTVLGEHPLHAGLMLQLLVTPQQHRIELDPRQARRAHRAHVRMQTCQPHPKHLRD